MVAVIHTTWAAALLRRLPGQLRSALDAWSQRVAQRRALARRQRGARVARPLPPVVLGHACLPHPWRD